MASANKFDQSSEMDYTEQKKSLEAMCQSLEELGEEFTEIGVQCSILQMELVSEFNPQVTEALDQAIAECEKCQERINSLLEPDGEAWRRFCEEQCALPSQNDAETQSNETPSEDIDIQTNTSSDTQLDGMSLD